MEKTNQSPQGGFFSHFYMSSGATIYPALAAMIQNLAKFETYFTKIMNDAIKGQQANSKAAADATESSLNHQADGLRDQAWASIAGAAGSLGTTAVSFGIDTYNLKTATTGTEEIENAQEYQDAYKSRVAEVSVMDTPVTGDTNEAALETYKRHTTETDDVIKNKLSSGDADHIKNADANQAKDGYDAMSRAIERKQSENKLDMNRLDRWQGYMRMLDGFVQAVPHSVGNFLQANETSEQAIQEKLKIYRTSSQDLNKAIEGQADKQFSDTASEMTQLIQQFSQLAGADRHQSA